MKRFIKEGMSIFLMLCSSVLFSQTSLWQDAGANGSELQAGSLVEVRVHEVFRINIDSEWRLNSKAELNLTPDTKNLPFLSASNQNKSGSKDAQARYRIRDSFYFNMQAVIGEPQAGSGLYPIQARRVIVIDLKPTQVVLSGLIHPKHVKGDAIESKHIAELRLNVTTRPPSDRDTSIALKPPLPEEITDPERPPPATAELSEQEKQRILLRHLQEVIGLLNQ